MYYKVLSLSVAKELKDFGTVQSGDMSLAKVQNMFIIDYHLLPYMKSNTVYTCVEHSPVCKVY